MNVKEVIRGGFGRSQMVTNMLLEDLTDAEMLERPAPGANHIAWQLGHLITSFNMFGQRIKEGSMPALPDGFTEQHSKETAASDDASAFLSKDQYLKLLDENRAALLAMVDELDDAGLDAAAPDDFKEFAPKVGDVLELASSHEMMHTGQFSVLRRKLGKPVKF